jgi:hypothetical protein
VYFWQTASVVFFWVGYAGGQLLIVVSFSILFALSYNAVTKPSNQPGSLKADIVKQQEYNSLSDDVHVEAPSPVFYSSDDNQT